jgi:hypothetical protein
MKVLLGIIGGVVGLAALIFFLNLVGFANFAFFNPKMEAVRNATFKQSQSYNDSMIRDLYNLKMQYEQATPEQKVGLRAFILHQFSVYPKDSLPVDLASFYSTLTGN